MTATKITRRAAIRAVGGLSLASITAAAQTSPGLQVGRPTGRQLPDKTSFVPSGITYLDSGSQHPVTTGAKAAVDSYLASRMLDPKSAGYSRGDDAVRQKFAQLINAADKDEIAFVPSTMAGEQMVLRGLGLPYTGGHVVTDTLHFFGSLPIYEELSRQGVDVTWLHAKDGRILLSDMKQAIRNDTKLVALSSVSTINGFEHDLKKVCDIAHAKGALVYADMIHGAGCVPMDVRAVGVDFAACATYKWLMGDFGLGFIYARKEAQGRLRRTEFGYYGVGAFETHIYPFDPPGTRIADYTFHDSAEGRFAHGTYAHAVVVQLGHSLDYIMGIGVPAIQAHAQTMTNHLKLELPRLGYALMTPPETTTPIVTCALENAREKIGSRLAAANVRITIARNRFRITPSVFNDAADIERFLSVVGRA
jgi:selenocysteine lyase/cysteine desulfurase